MADTFRQARTIYNMPLSRPELENIIREEIGALLSEASKKKGKPNCSPGNTHHRADGTFGNKGNAKSWSLQFVKGSPDCKSGVTKAPGARATKLPCGRKSKNNPNQKAPYRCKDGSKVEEQFGLVEDAEPSTVQLKQDLARARTRIKELEDYVSKLKATELARCLRKVNVTQKAAAGDLFGGGK